MNEEKKIETVKRCMICKSEGITPNTDAFDITGMDYCDACAN